MLQTVRSWLFPALLTGLLVFLAGSVPAAAGAAPAPLASPGEAMTLLVQAFPVLGAWIGASPAPVATPEGEAATTGNEIEQARDGNETDPNQLPPPDEAPARDGGYGPWGDEASGPWPRS